MSAPLDFSPPPPPAIVRPDMRKKLVRPTAGPVLVHDTGSMRPSLTGDTWVDLETPHIETIKEGDAILYEWPARGVIAAHRVKRVKRAANGKPYFICEGDGNHHVADSINVDESNYIGKFNLPQKFSPPPAPSVQFEPKD